MNRLATEKAAYLRHAAHQRIDWYPWCDEAFDRARGEDKPVFLSSGAVWCHWCHVMAKECFEDDGIIRLLNENFICIKLDRDERPDIDRRYQQAVAAMGSGGGWPLSVFLTPERKPFFGGTYFPPDDSLGRPGFRKVLAAIFEAFRSKRGEIAEYTERVAGLFKPQQSVLADATALQVDEALKSVISAFDSRNGGFGTAPKFPMPGAHDFLIKRSFFTSDSATVAVVKKTLEAMALGGFRDHLGGGFHRYSTDEAWIVPHFEKMADDNAWLLRNYVDAYRSWGDGLYREVALGIIEFATTVLSDPAGGFYSSQDADVTPDDEGGFFTWTEDALRAPLDDTEFPILREHLFHERGVTHHDPLKRVLFAVVSPEEIARSQGMDVDAVKAIIARGKEKLLRARNLRVQPMIDRTIYTNLNGLFITAFLQAYRAFGSDAVLSLALRAIDRVLDLRLNNGVLQHSEGTEAFFEDHVFFVEALVSAYEVTGSRRYLEEADRLFGLCLEKFWDEKGGGFYDTAAEVLGVRLKTIEDIPHPSPNALGIILLEKMAELTGREAYRQRALKALRLFSLRAQEFGVHAGYYYAALDSHLHALTLAVHTGADDALAQAAKTVWYPFLTISYGGDEGYLLPCVRGRCFEPIVDPEHLAMFVAGFR